MKTNIPSTILYGCNEIEVHYKRQLFNKMQHIKNSEDANRILRSYINLERIDLKEFFWIIPLSNANRVLGISEIGSGTVKGVATNIQEIIQLALLTNSSAIVVCHNHPSGNLKPSEADKEVTKKICSACKLFDIRLLDHLILTSESYFSFSDNHLL